MRSIYDNVTIAGIVGPVLNTTGVVATGASVDTKGYNSAMVKVFTTAITGQPAAGGGSIAVVLQESADNSSFSTALDRSGATIGFTVTATTPAVVGSCRVEGLGTTRLRYLRVVTTAAFSTPTATNVFTSVGVIALGNSYQRPVTTTVSNT